MKKALLLKTAVALALTAPTLSMAESQLVIGTGNASAKLAFRVTIPRVLFLGVGTGSATLANNTTVDLVSFDYSASPQAVGTGTGGTATGNVVPVRVVGNNGTIGLTASVAGALSNGNGDTIAWDQITATTSVAELPSPPIPLTGSSATASNVTPTLGTKVTDRTANWTFRYANNTVVPAGVYGGTGGAQVTYTASMP